MNWQSIANGLPLESDRSEQSFPYQFLSALSVIVISLSTVQKEQAVDSKRLAVEIRAIRTVIPVQQPYQFLSALSVIVISLQLCQKNWQSIANGLPLESDQSEQSFPYQSLSALSVNVISLSTVSNELAVDSNRFAVGIRSIGTVVPLSVLISVISDCYQFVNCAKRTGSR